MSKEDVYDNLFDDWNSTPTPDKPQPRGKVPYGNYTVRIERTALTRSKNEKPMFSWEFHIVGGEHAGRRLYKSNYIGTPAAVGWFKSDLLACGIDVPAKMNKAVLTKLQGELLDLLLAVSYREGKNGYDKVYINFPKGYSDREPVQAKPAEPKRDENFDDVPF